MWCRRIVRVAAVIALVSTGIAQALELCNKNHYILDEPCLLGWVPANRGLTDLDVQVVAVDPARPKTLYAGGPSGIFKSLDGGVSWSMPGPMMYLHDDAVAAARAYLPGLQPGFKVRSTVAHVAIDKHEPGTVYAATVPTWGCVWAQRHIFKSIDGGANWTNAVNPMLGGCDAIQSMVLAPSTAGSLFLGNGGWDEYYFPAARSLDGGATWTPLEYLDLHTMAVDPRNSRTLYAGASWFENPFTPVPSGVLKSKDGGTTWSATGLAATGITALAIDPSDSLTLYAATRGSPRSAADGLYKSIDGGVNWEPVGEGLGSLLRRSSATAILVDSQQARNVYMVTSDNGVWRSNDAGDTWTALNDGLPSLKVRSLALAAGAPNVLYAATAEGVFVLYDAMAESAPIAPAEITP